ncbi:MAG: branched-chain amino acid ABC transporter ATP-binding protein/permease [Chloroflexota bacterium]
MTSVLDSPPLLALARFLAGRHAWIVLFVVAAVIPIVLLGNSYLMSSFAIIAIFSIVVLSLDLVMGYGGLPNFGVNGFFALGAYVMGVLAAKLGIPLALGAAIAVLLNLAVAFLIGVATLRMKHYYFAVASLGLGVIAVQVIGGLPDQTGGWSGLTGIPKISALGYTLSSDLAFYVVSCVALFISLAAGRNLVGSRFGRAIQAISTDELATEAVGIFVAEHKVKLFMVTSVFASLAGSLYVLFLRVPTPANFDVPVLVEMTLMLFLGGQRTLWGAIIGSAIMRLLPEVMGGFHDFTTALQGLTLILILLFLPKGLAGKAEEVWKERLRPRVVMDRYASAQARNGHDASQRFDGRTAGEGPLLEATGLSKRFGGVQAVSELTFTVPRRKIKAIIGPNGAGKTTAFNLLTKVITPDDGYAFFNGISLKAYKPHEVSRMGMVRTFQTPRLFATMSALENVKVGLHTHLKAGIMNALVPLAGTQREEHDAEERAYALLELTGIALRASTIADKLPFGERRLLEIARGLAVQPSLILLDEPAAGLNETEKDRLSELLLKLRDAGLTLLLVEHDMRVVMNIADEVLVMNYGQKIADGTPAEIQRNDAVLKAYLGEDTVYAAN